MKKILFVLLIIFAVAGGFLFFLNKNSGARGKIAEATCSLRGGSMVESGCGIARCTYKCVVPYRDGGKSCSHSNQCSHHCITNDPRLPYPFSERGSQKQIEQGLTKLQQCTRTAADTYDCTGMKLTGTCEQQEQKNCEYRWEFNNGIISSIFADCSL